MRVRDWQDILSEVTESKADPDGWRAVAGDRSSGLGEDMFFGHPDRGVFHLKTYAKNPFEVKGVGSRVARSLDDELEPLFPTKAGGRFGVQPRIEDEDEAKEAATKLEGVLGAHADAPTTGDDLFDDVMEALGSPAFGPMDYEFDSRTEALDDLSSEFEEAQELLDSELDDLIDDDGVDRGFM
ncbi:hypothetical protein [Natronomonas sp. EA1]|uniref:hypothetical protein n=1 Tax=Natronomonas sp. EA1 TaxID=3421655 RepID=UPI003EC04580